MTAFQSYKYIGPEHIKRNVKEGCGGQKIIQTTDIIQWLRTSQQQWIHNAITLIFVISEQKELLITDRHAEHVMCAGGK